MLPIYTHPSPQITGPWDATPIYDIPAPFNGTTLMAYTGKAHPEVSSTPRRTRSPLISDNRSM